MGGIVSVGAWGVSKATAAMFRGLLRVCCYAPSPTQRGGSILAPRMRRRCFKNVKLANNPEGLCFCRIQNETHIRTAGVPEGQQGIIEECKDCKIFIFGDCASLTIDCCSNCYIHVASVDGSVMMRNCRSCICTLCCRQFRAGECKSCDVKLCCYTRPIIEKCANLRFGCVDKSSLAIADQVGTMKVSDWSNQWTDIYDFTPDPATPHWGCLPEMQDWSKETRKGECWQECFVLFLERDAALAYAYAFTAVWKTLVISLLSQSIHSRAPSVHTITVRGGEQELCIVNVSRPDSENKSILTKFLHTLGFHGNDLHTRLLVLIAAKVIAMEIAGADCRQNLQGAIHELGNDKAHFFMTCTLQDPQQANCCYYAATTLGEDICGSNCQLLLQKALQREDPATLI